MNMEYIKTNTKYKHNVRYKKRWELFKVWRKVSHVHLRAAARAQQMECLMKTCQRIQIHNKNTMVRIEIIRNYCLVKWGTKEYKYKIKFELKNRLGKIDDVLPNFIRSNQCLSARHWRVYATRPEYLYY